MAGRGVAAATLVLLAGALLVVTEILTSDTLITMTLRKYYANGGEPGDLVVPALGTLDSISNPNALALRQLRSRQLALEPGPEAEAEAGAGPPRRRPPARVYVVTLDDVPGAAAANRGRYEAFLEAWTRTCGDQLAFVRCPGVVDGRQGYGLTKAYVACIERAIQERAATDDHGDAPVLFMEDDSRLFLEDGGEFCKASTRQRLWAAAPSDAFVIMYVGRWAHLTRINAAELRAVLRSIFPGSEIYFSKGHFEIYFAGK